MTALLFSLAGLAVVGQNLVTVRLPKEDNRLLSAGVLGSSGYVSLVYRHSVELTQVEGRFRLGPGHKLAAFETRMASVGTGLPNAEPGRTRLEKNWIVVDEGMRSVGRVRFYMEPINRTRIRLAGRQVPLDRVRSGSILQIDAERPALWQWALWRTMNIPWNPQGEKQ